MSDAQPQAPPPQQWETVGRAADRHRWLWPVASSMVGALLVGGSFVAGLLVRSFSAGWEARQVATEYVTQEQLGARVRPVEERIDAVDSHLKQLESCCNDYAASSGWNEWTTRCVLAIRERRPGPPLPVDLDRRTHAPYTLASAASMLR